MNDLWEACCRSFFFDLGMNQPPQTVAFWCSNKKIKHLKYYYLNESCTYVVSSVSIKEWWLRPRNADKFNLID